MRPSIDYILMETAKLYATRATCDRTVLISWMGMTNPATDPFMLRLTRWLLQHEQGSLQLDLRLTAL